MGTYYLYSMSKETNMNKRHGGPYDRGSADSYYQRNRRPHYFTGDTYKSQEILLEPGTPAYDEYMQGYNDNEASQNFKDWG